MKRYSFFFLLIFSFAFLSNKETFAQEKDTFIFSQPVQLDEVVIRATKSGFDIHDFIRLIQKDTTFYKAFRSLHLTTYHAENHIRVFNKKGTKIIASLESETKQIYRDRCRTMNVLEEQTSGRFYNKDGSYRFFTCEMYANLFFTKGKVCHENNIVKGYLEKEEKGKGRLEKSKMQLKHLIFNPGGRIEGIPFISNKVAIFDPEIAEMYDFQIKAEEKNGVSCYLFEAKAKKDFLSKVVIKNFRTWLRVSDFSIISRDYSLSYNAGIYDFDVTMHVDLKKVNNELLPAHITYDGNWYVLTKGRERVKFSAKFDY